MPVGALARAEGESMMLNAAVFSVDGKAAVRASVRDGIEGAASVGRLVAEELISGGAAELLAAGSGE